MKRLFLIIKQWFCGQRGHDWQYELYEVKDYKRQRMVCPQCGVFYIIEQWPYKEGEGFELEKGMGRIESHVP